MSMILLAVEDTDRDSLIRDLLTAEGYWVTTANSHEEAVRAAADHAPRLLIVDARLGRAEGLLETFRHHDTGPAVLLLIDEGEEPAAHGPATIERGQDPEKLLAAVRDSLEAPREAVSDPETVSDEQLTTTDLFGEILAGLGEERDLEESAAADPTDRPEQEDRVEEAEEEVAESEAEPVEAEEEVAESEAEPVEAEEEAAEPEAEAAEPEEETEEAEEEAVEPEAEAAEPEEETEEAEEEATEPEAEAAAPEEETEEAEEEAAEPEEPAAEGEVAAAAKPATVEEEVSELVESTDEDLEKKEESTGEESELEIEQQVEDLLAEEDETWHDEREEDTDSLSIHDVLAVEAAEGEEEGELVELAAATDGDEDGAEAEDKSEDRRDQVGGYELLQLVEVTDYAERWKARKAGGEGTEGLLVRLRPEVRGKTGVLDNFVNGYSRAVAWDDDTLVRVLDLGRDKDIDFVVTEELEGHSLQELVHRVRRMEGRTPLGISLLIAERIARGLSVIEAQSSSSRHGRLVLSSVWVGKGGRIVLRDFGAERSIDDEVPAISDWSAWRFIAPEAWGGGGDIRSDFYSLGAIVYEMVTGQPIHGADDHETLDREVHGNKIAAAQKVDPTIPSEINDWIMTLLDPNPKQRPQSAARVAKKIERSLKALPTRPGDAELTAYLRQLFAARVPAANRDRLPLPEDLPLVAVVAPEPARSEKSSGIDPRWWWVIAIVLGFIAGYLLLRTLVDASATSDNAIGPDAVIEVARAHPGEPVMDTQQA